MNHFHSGFSDELSKIAKLNPKTKAWAFARGMTGGAFGALMGTALTASANMSRPKDQRVSPLKAGLTMGLLGAASGLGRGFMEKGIERKLFKRFAPG